MAKGRTKGVSSNPLTNYFARREPRPPVGETPKAASAGPGNGARVGGGPDPSPVSPAESPVESPVESVSPVTPKEHLGPAPGTSSGPMAWVGSAGALIGRLAQMGSQPLSQGPSKLDTDGFRSPARSPAHSPPRSRAGSPILSDRKPRAAPLQSPAMPLDTRKPPASHQAPQRPLFSPDPSSSPLSDLDHTLASSAPISASPFVRHIQSSKNESPPRSKARPNGAASLRNLGDFLVLEHELTIDEGNVDDNDDDDLGDDMGIPSFLKKSLPAVAQISSATTYVETEVVDAVRRSHRPQEVVSYKLPPMDPFRDPQSSSIFASLGHESKDPLPLPSIPAKRKVPVAFSLDSLLRDQRSDRAKEERYIVMNERLAKGGHDSSDDELFARDGDLESTSGLNQNLLSGEDGLHGAHLLAQDRQMITVTRLQVFSGARKGHNPPYVFEKADREDPTMQEVEVFVQDSAMTNLYYTMYSITALSQTDLHQDIPPRLASWLWHALLFTPHHESIPTSHHLLLTSFIHRGGRLFGKDALTKVLPRTFSAFGCSPDIWISGASLDKFMVETQQRADVTEEEALIELEDSRPWQRLSLALVVLAEVVERRLVDLPAQSEWLPLLGGIAILLADLQSFAYEVRLGALFDCLLEAIPDKLWPPMMLQLLNHVVCTFQGHRSLQGKLLAALPQSSILSRSTVLRRRLAQVFVLVPCEAMAMPLTKQSLDRWFGHEQPSSAAFFHDSSSTVPSHLPRLVNDLCESLGTDPVYQLRNDTNYGYLGHAIQVLGIALGNCIAADKEAGRGLTARLKAMSTKIKDSRGVFMNRTMAKHHITQLYTVSKFLLGHGDLSGGGSRKGSMLSWVGKK